MTTRSDSGEGASAPDPAPAHHAIAAELRWDCGHPISAHTRAEALICKRQKENVAVALTAASPPDAILHATTARLWNGYIDAIIATRGPKLVLSAGDIRRMFELHHMAGSIVGR